MKVLVYHWTQDNFPKPRGGGIPVYQRDLVSKLLDFDEIQLSVLSSGSSDLYDFLRPASRIESLPSSTSGPKRFGLINSPIPSPAALSFGNFLSLRHSETAEIFFDFVIKHGFNVIHFNHFEGLPAEVLTIKRHLPDIKILFSMHDYYSLCPQVHFLYQGKELCEDSQSGQKCQSCVQVDTQNFSVEKWRTDRLFRLIDKMGLNPVGRLSMAIKDLAKKIVLRRNETNQHLTPPEETFREWHQIVDLINEHVDYVLPVSDRARQIAIRQGIKPDLLNVLRLGKKEAVHFSECVPPNRPFIMENDCLTLVYLGYMSIHKGFFFLLEAFERMPSALSKRINLVIAAKSPRDPSVLNRLMALRTKLNQLTHHDGYTHDQLDEILKPGSIGLLCHLWEETGPLTAWEMHCRRIPFLTSDLGGGPEISGCKAMVYKHGNVQEFIEKIKMILDGKITYEEYWKDSIAPITVDEHCRELLGLYRS